MSDDRPHITLTAGNDYVTVGLNGEVAVITAQEALELARRITATAHGAEHIAALLSPAPVAAQQAPLRATEAEQAAPLPLPPDTAQQAPQRRQRRAPDRSKSWKAARRKVRDYLRASVESHTATEVRDGAGIGSETAKVVLSKLAADGDVMTLPGKRGGSLRYVWRRDWPAMLRVYRHISDECQINPNSKLYTCILEDRLYPRQAKSVTTRAVQDCEALGLLVRRGERVQLPDLTYREAPLAIGAPWPKEHSNSNSNVTLWSEHA